MWIEVGCTTARVLRATDEEAAWLRDYMSFPDARARFRAFGPREVRMYDDLHASFPAGLVPLVRKDAPKEGFAVEVADRTAPAPVDPDANLAWLRDYQRDAVRAVVTRRRGIIHLATGGGKTDVAVGVVRSVPTAGWLFLVHRTTLVHQAAERFSLRAREHGVDLGEPGVIGEGTWREGDVLTCATFQSLAAALRNGGAHATRARELLERVGGLIIDEAHCTPAEQFWRVAMGTTRAAYRVGLSGTPLARGDKRSVLAVAALGPVVYRLRAERLIDEGVLAKPTIRLVPVEQVSERVTWSGVYNELVVKSRVRNAAVVAAALRAEKPAFVFVQNIAHGRTLEKALLRSGVRTGFVWGGHSTDWRQSAVRSLVAGRVDVLVCSVVFQEGVDVPALRAVVVASGGRSVIAALQRIGRGMRVERDAAGAVTKASFEVWDFADRGHGWLERHARERRQAYLKEGFDVVVDDGLPVVAKVG